MDQYISVFIFKKIWYFIGKTYKFILFVLSTLLTSKVSTKKLTGLFMYGLTLLAKLKVLLLALLPRSSVISLKNVSLSTANLLQHNNRLRKKIKGEEERRKKEKLWKEWREIKTKFCCLGFYYSFSLFVLLKWVKLYSIFFFFSMLYTIGRKVDSYCGINTLIIHSVSLCILVALLPCVDEIIFWKY